MIKNKFFLLLLIFFLVLVTLKLVPSFRGKVLHVTNNIRLLLVEDITQIKDKIESYKDQSKKILLLTKQIEILKPIAMQSKSNELALKKLLKETNLQYKHPSLHLVRTLSFEKLGDYNTMWLDFKDFEPNKIYGLIYKGYVAGIVREKDGNPLALFSLDPTVTLSVYIGKYKTEGVIFGNNSNMLIKYIQKFYTIKVGDEVVTSGKDGIFNEGVKIGKVTKITEKELYNEATVEPYIYATHAKYLYAIDIHNPKQN